MNARTWFVSACVTAALVAGCRPASSPRGPQATGAPALLPATEPDRAWTTRGHFRHLTFQNPVFAVMPPRNPRLWFIGEREGRIFVVADDPDAREKQPVLDLRSKTLGWQDCGLLNLVFHPEFGEPGSPNRGYFYVWYNHTERPHPGPDHPFHGHPSATASPATPSPTARVPPTRPRPSC
jgi:hypothetical protein